MDKVRQSGGAVVREKSKAGEMGWSAHVKDTGGNVRRTVLALATSPRREGPFP